MSDSIPEAVIGLADAIGVSNIAALPGCWEHDVDGTWRLAVNGKREKVATKNGVEVPPFHIYVEYNGWPAGILSITGEGEFAAGTGANEDAFIAALDAAAKRAEEGRR